MNIVLDSNVLFSALIRDSLTRRLILEYEGSFLFPKYIFVELEKHIDEIFKKSQMTKEEFDKLLGLLLRKVLIVPDEALRDFKEEAVTIMENIDINDAVFVACALAYSNSVIWSDDKDFKKQLVILIMTTKQMKDFIWKG
jgi:predicted nucleic acid-binding protein